MISTIQFSILVVSVSLLVTLFLPGISSQQKKKGSSTTTTKAPDKSNAAAPAAAPQGKGKAGDAQGPTVPGLEYIGSYDGRYGLWVGANKVTRDEGWKLCKTIQQFTKTPASLISIDAVERNEDMKNTFKILQDKKPNIEHFWIESFLKKINGREIMIIVNRDGSIKEVDVTGRGLFADRKRRATEAQEHKISRPRLYLISRSKRDEDDPNSYNPGQVTVMETHYPWLPSWETNKPGCTVEGCDPRVCTITTPACTIDSKDCTVGTPKCELVPSGPCTAICEQCDVTQPDCWQGRTECTLQEDRKCDVVPPDCEIETPPCTVERPPCISQKAGCYVETVNKTCEVSVRCQGQLGGNCTTMPRPCKKGEKPPSDSNGCTEVVCDPLLLCLTPTVCKQDVMKCPYGKTFCPPETVHCPAPKVTCGKPETTCTEPVFDCPFPKVVCEEPNVNCTPAKISCPPTITKCGHPTINCPPPEVNCPPPILECEPPKPCTVIDRECNKTTTCDTETCNCMFLRRLIQPNELGDRYESYGSRCDQLIVPLCESKFR